jgi:hypothetical protein
MYYLIFVILAAIVVGVVLVIEHLGDPASLEREYAEAFAANRAKMSKTSLEGSRVSTGNSPDQAQ